MQTTRAGWLALVAAVLAVMAAPATARGDAVTQWNSNANDAILAANPTAHSSVLSSAMVQGAVYDAVNGIVGGYTPYLVKPAVSPSASTDAAVATAAYRVLLAVVPSSQTAALATLAAQYDAALGAIPNGAAKDRRDQRRRDRRCGDARGTRKRRPQPDDALPVRLRDDPRRLARLPAADRARADAVGGERDAVPGPERGDASHEGSERAHERRVREGSQRGQVGRRVREHDADRGPDERGDLLAVAAALHLGRSHALALGPVRALDPSRTHGSSRRSRLAGGRRCDRLLERQVPLELLAAARRDPPRGHGRESRDRGRSDLEAAVRPGYADDAAARDAELPRPSVRAQLPQQRRPARVRGLLRHRPDRVRPLQHALRGHAGVDAALHPLLGRARTRSSVHACGAGSTSAPPTCRARGSGAKVANWEQAHYFLPTCGAITPSASSNQP